MNDLTPHQRDILIAMVDCKYCDRKFQSTRALGSHVRFLHPEHFVYRKVPLYGTWECMISRCYNPKHKHYKNYGGRGITVCDRWKDLQLFIMDMGERPPGYTLDREDNNGNYEPSNCRWASRLTQNRNARTNVYYTYKGETKCLAEWSSILGIQDNALRHRIKLYGVEKAISFGGRLRPYECRKLSTSLPTAL